MPAGHCPSKHQKGFTLLEILVAITVLALLLGIAVPNLRTTIQNNRITATANEFTSAFQFARSEALKRGVPVSVCAADTADGEDDPECGDDWSEGWMVFVDTAGVGVDPPVVGELLRVWQPRLQGMNIEEDSDTEFVRYLPAGRLDDVSTPPIEFSLLADDCSRDQGRDITIERSGSVRVQRVNCD